jgi:hypothetical protein
MGVQFEERAQPCTRCGALVAIKVVTPDQPRRSGEPRRVVIHDEDGTPADTSCTRGLD